MSSMTITSLALLKTRYDFEKKDIIDTFLSLAHASVAQHQAEKFSVEQLKQWFSDDYGLDLPLAPTKLIANRMVKRKVAKREKSLYCPLGKLPDLNEFNKNRAELLSHYRAIIISFKKFIVDSFDKKLSADECEQCLLKYIDEYTLECIDAAQNGSIIKARGEDPAHWRFIVSRYVGHISESSPEHFSYFVTVLTGRMLSNALLARDLSGSGMKFKKTTIYLDTPILLHILGVVGEDNERYAKETMGLLREAKAKLCVLSHTLEETLLVLRSIENRMETPTGGYGEAIVALRQAGKRASDVAFIRSRINEILVSEYIEKAKTPSHINQYQIDEQALEHEMSIKNLDYSSAAAKKADIDSIRSIYVLRREHMPTRVEDSRAVLLTSNRALALAAFEYGKRHQESKEVSTVFTDFTLTNIVWLKSPLKYQNLPEQLLLANCYSVLKPSNKLWERFVEELDHLRNTNKITPKQHRFLRYELRIRYSLLDSTFGDEDEITDALIFDLLEDYEKSVKQPLHEEIEEISAERDKALDRASENEKKVLKIKTRIRRLSKGVGTLSKYIFMFMFIALIAWAFLSDTFRVPDNNWQKWATVMSMAALLVCTVLNLAFGWNALNPIKWIANKIEVIVESLLREWTGA